MVTSDHKPNLMFSQYEIANIKSVWLSLDLCENFSDSNICTKNSIPMFTYNKINMERFQIELGLNIFNSELTSRNVVRISNYNIGLLDRYSILLSNQNVELIKNDYQVDSFINLITIMIYHLEYGKSVPQDFIVQLAKINSRLYSINCRNYAILGNSLIKTIAFFSMRFNGDKRQIFSKFLSKLLTALVYYSHDSGIINIAQIHDHLSNGKSIHQTISNNLHDNQIHPTLTNGSTSTISNSYSPPRKSSTMSIFSQPSECTEDSSLLSLTMGDNNSEISSEIPPDEQSIIANMTKSINFNFSEGIAEEVEVEEADPEAEEATITQSYDDGNIPDDSYDYLNSFGLSEIDNSPIQEPELPSNNDVDDLKSLESTKSNMSSFKNWNKFKRSKKEKKFVSKNLVRTQTNGSFNSISRRSVVGEDDGCVVM
ncbi:hypothetical protein K6H11_000915 [Candida tropicalis]